MRDAAKLFVGLHDFRSFMAKSTLASEKITRRVITNLDIFEGKSLCCSEYSWPLCITNDITDYKFFDIYVKSSGFLYKQVSSAVSDFIFMHLYYKVRAYIIRMCC